MSNVSEPPVMPEEEFTVWKQSWRGELARRRGLSVARRIGDLIGATGMERRRPRSNECDYHERSAIIKIAGPRTSGFKLTHASVFRAEVLIAAREIGTGTYDVRELDIARWWGSEPNLSWPQLSIEWGLVRREGRPLGIADVKRMTWEPCE